MKQINSNLTGSLTIKSQPSSIIITTIEESQNETQKKSLRSSPSDVIIKNAIENIVALAEQKLEENRLTKKHLNNFSREFAESYINENIDMHMFNGEQKRLTYEETEPQNIKGDNLCPASTSVEEKFKSVDDVISLPGTIVNETVGRLTRNMSTVSRVSRNTNKNNINSNRNQSNESIKNSSSTKKAPKVYEFVKLNEDHLPKTEDSLLNNDPYVEELRRIKESKPKIELKTKEEKKSNSLREKIKLEDKFSYDFTGDILKINQKHQQKSTLLTAQIKTVQNEGLINRPYESFIKNTPTNIDNPNLKRDKAKKLPSTRQPDVEFSNVMSLVQNFEIKEGAKFIHNKATLEKKKKEPSLGDIKNSLSLNKISRSEFAKLKSIDSENIKINKTLLLKSSMSPSLPSLKNNIEAQELTKTENINDTYSSYNGKNKIYQSINSDRTQIRSLPKHTNMKKNNKFLLTERSHEIVSVQNYELSEMLVDERFDIKEGDMAYAKFEEEDQIIKKNSSNLEALEPRDIANLHYIKTGGTIGKLELPKITYRLNDSLSSSKNEKLPNSILESKSKIKGKRNQNEFERLKKHFEDKLRV